MRSLVMLPLVLAGCTGIIGERPQGSDTTSDPELACAQRPQLKRLSGVQYRAVISELLPGWEDAARMPVPFSQARREDFFSTWAQRASIGEYELDDVWLAAERVAGAWASAPENVCTGATRDDCVRRVWGAALRTLWSRPASDAELSEIAEALAQAETELAPVQATTAVMRSALMSPLFLFRSEALDGSMSAHELAAALSFTLLDRPPDEALDAFATAGDLEPELIRAEAARLMERPSELPALRRFMRELFQYEAAGSVRKDAQAYPFHRPAQLIDDTERVIERLIDEHARAGLLRALLTTDLVYVRADTAASWGVVAAAADGDFAHDPSRAGVLTHPSWLAAMSHPDANHLVRRGLFVRENLLCGEVPPIPGGVVPQIPEVPGQSLRERISEHSQNPECNVCHQLMDPLGAGFEAWDHLGRARSDDNGATIDPSGELTGAGEAFDGPYADVRELMHRLADSPAVEACWVKQLYRFVHGREALPSDRCELERLTTLYRTSGEDTLAVIAEMFASPEYLRRTALTEEPTP